MKLAILFLVLGAALALPQNFFLSFYPKHHASSFADPSSDVIRGPVNLMQQRGGYGNPLKSFGIPYFGNGGYANEDPSMMEDRSPSIYSSEDDDNSVQSRANPYARLMGNLYGGGLLYPFIPSYSKVITTLYAFTATINSTLTMSVVSTCIPLASFGNTASTANCAQAGRKRRAIWDDSDHLEDIAPSKVEEVVPTVAQELPALERAARDVQIASSKDERPEQVENPKSRQKRLFFGFAQPLTLTSIITTASTLTTFTQLTTTSTLTGFSSFSCLPPGTAICR